MDARPDRIATASPQSAPSGTLTFVFTDIEGSTQRWERFPVAMQDAVRRHDELVRTALLEHHGHIFKTIGDAFCAVFSRPQDAAAAMLAAQRRLATADYSAVDGLRVRMAAHTGTAEERDADYFGPVVNRVARLLSIGHGGQTLISGVLSELLRGELPESAQLRDLGEHRLKDLARPEHVYALDFPGLRSDFPPLRSLNALPNNLPAALTNFVGRAADVPAITALVRSNRLVTITGSGGIGKTRVSLQVAADLLDGSGDGVWFIELAALTNPEYIASTIALAMNITLPSAGDASINLVHELQTKCALLILDNCEHLLDPVARLVAMILRACPRVTVFASSRQPLGLSGELVYRLPSLALPDATSGQAITAAEAVRHEAIQLFVERARALDHRFGLTDANASTIVDICRRLDGIALAIELAAARVRVLSLQQVRDRLDARFRVLAGGRRDVLPRQQTLRALIDWSYDLLDARERALFRRLGIFVSGFMLEGAVALSDGMELDAIDAIELLSSLVDKSLVLTEPRGDVLRYRLLESTRDYAREKLAAAGESPTTSHDHVRYLRDCFAEARTLYEQTSDRARLEDVMLRELEEARAALDAAVAGPDALIGAGLLAEIGTCWQDLGVDAEGITRIEAFLPVVPADASLLTARLAIALVWLAANTYRTARAFEAATLAVEHARKAGDPLVLAEALRAISLTAARLRRFDDAEQALTEAEAVPGLTGPLRRRLLQVRASLCSQQGDYATAARVLERLRAELRALGSVDRERVVGLNLAELSFALGDTQRALELTRAYLPALRALPDRTLLVETLTGLAGYLAAVDDLTGCAAAAREALAELAPREPGSALVALAIEQVALVIALGGDRHRAQRLLGYVEATLERHGHQRIFAERSTYERLSALLGTERVAAPLTPAQALELALTDSESAGRTFSVQDNT